MTRLLNLHIENKMDKMVDITRVMALKLTSKINHYLLSIIIIGLTAWVCSPLSNTQGYHVVSFILLFIVSFLATFMAIGPILLASTLSSLVWNYFFIPPHNTFKIDKTEDLLMFCMFFMIALLNGIFTNRVRRQEKLAIDREERTHALFQLTRELSKANGFENVIVIAENDIKKHFGIKPYFFTQDGNNKLVNNVNVNGEEIPEVPELSVAKWVYKNNKTAGKFSKQFPDEAFTYFPLPGTMLKPGVVAVKTESLFTGNVKNFWETFLTQISNALEREFLGELAQKARFLDESDRLYKTLFNSISHEFRIPVSTIIGAVDTLSSAQHPGNIQRALYSEIFTASLRLNRLIENLLNMSRLESGRISARLDWYDVNDLVNKVSHDLEEELKPYTLQILIPEDMPLVKIDFGLMEQILYNLLINSCEYAPASTDIDIYIQYESGQLIIKIMDRGPGFPQDAMNNVFNKFFKVNGTKSGGLGLGLSIVKGFVEAHKGTIVVENRHNGGAVFTIKIPTVIPEMNELTLDT